MALIIFELNNNTKSLFEVLLLLSSYSGDVVTFFGGKARKKCSIAGMRKPKRRRKVRSGRPSVVSPRLASNSLPAPLPSTAAAAVHHGEQSRSLNVQLRTRVHGLDGAAHAFDGAAHALQPGRRCPGRCRCRRSRRQCPNLFGGREVHPNGDQGPRSSRSCEAQGTRERLRSFFEVVVVITDREETQGRGKNYTVGDARRRKGAWTGLRRCTCVFPTYSPSRSKSFSAYCQENNKRQGFPTVFLVHCPTPKSAPPSRRNGLTCFAHT